MWHTPIACGCHAQYYSIQANRTVGESGWTLEQSVFICLTFHFLYILTWSEYGPGPQARGCGLGVAVAAVVIRIFPLVNAYWRAYRIRFKLGWRFRELPHQDQHARKSRQ